METTGRKYVERSALFLFIQLCKKPLQSGKSEWKDIVTVSQGFHFAVGLTVKGRVLYADYDEDITRKVSEILKDWKDVVDVTVYGMDIYGVKADGECVSLNVVDVR